MPYRSDLFRAISAFLSFFTQNFLLLYMFFLFKKIKRLYALANIIFFLLPYHALLAQHPLKSQKEYRLLVHQIETHIQLDGVLSEPIWQKAEVAKDFFLNYPNDTTFATLQTEVRLAYNAHFFFVAVVCQDDNTKPFTVSSLRRDFDWEANDNVSIYLDPFGDGINGFAFTFNPMGVQREGLLFNGQNVASEWDNKWDLFVRRYEDKWIAEIAIPFKTLRYKNGTKSWKMNFARNDLKNNERSSWVPVPIAYWVSSLAFTGEINFENPLPHPGANLSVIPYLAGSMSKNHAEQRAMMSKANAGFDAKIAVTPSLNLDLTFNPDFSQVEVDQQVTNLERFEIFFPERRQFFLENNDLFGEFGFESVRPFFSRRIGIGRDTLTKLIVQNPILYGARLSGKLDKNWRVGLLNMQTAKDDAAGIQAQNFTVATFQRRVFSRSNLAGIFINRYRLQDNSEERYTRLLGLDYNLQSADNKWSGKLFFHKALTPKNLGDSHAHGSLIQYQTRNATLTWNHEYVGANFEINDIGFVRRNAHWRFNPKMEFTFYTEKSNTLVSHGIGSETDIYTDLNYQLNDRNIDVYYFLNFLNTVNLFVGYYNMYTRLFASFDPTNAGGLELPLGSQYQIQGIFAGYTSDSRKRFTYGFEGWAGGYFNGTNRSLAPFVSYRFQPYGTFRISAEYNDIRLPEPYSSAKFWLISPRLDLSFTKSIFLTTFLQYNEQTENVNINVRFQWRFKPVSDLFIVYSDNYSPEFKVKSRALVLKLSYWLNI